MGATRVRLGRRQLTVVPKTTIIGFVSKLSRSETIKLVYSELGSAKKAVTEPGRRRHNACSTGKLVLFAILYFLLKTFACLAGSAA